MKLITKTITKVANVFVTIANKRIAKEQKVVANEKVNDELNDLRRLHQFVNYLNKGFGSRKARKAFWCAMGKGEPVMTEELERLIKAYKEHE